MILDNEFCRSIADSLKAPQSDIGAAAKSVNGFLKMHQSVIQGEKTDSLSNLFERTAHSINVRFEKVFVDGNTDVKYTYNMERYFKCLERFRVIESERSYIFENVLVNMIFVTPPHEGLFKSFFNLAMFYNILKISLPAFLEEEWNDRDLAKAITYSAKMVVNTKMTEKVSERDFIEHDSFDLPHIAFMIS